ncbi:MAG: transposase [Gemmatimonadota bacterium]|nr:transposase [Gemmatimonadota bacterium]MDE2871105.1 transposase [Gemmatimonadota bacterium]
MKRLSHDPRGLRRLLDRLVREHEVHACYEASGAGYVPERMIRSWGHECEIVAPSLIPQRPGQRRKHDRKDAEELARLYRAGELVTIRVPSDREERVRDLVRCRETLQREALKSRRKPRNRGYSYSAGDGVRALQAWRDRRSWTIRRPVACQFPPIGLITGKSQFGRKGAFPMRTPRITLLLAALPLACDLDTVPEEVVSPAGPESEETTAAVVAVGYDPDEPVPQSLLGFRPDPRSDRQLRLYGHEPHTRDMYPEARTREDFRKGARNCVRVLTDLGGGANYLEEGAFRSAEEQDWWRGRMLAKEAVYGAGAEEAACEREWLQMALLVARGDWVDVISPGRLRESILRELEWEQERLDSLGKTWEDRHGYYRPYPPPADAKAAARLEGWLEVRK